MTLIARIRSTSPVAIVGIVFGLAAAMRVGVPAAIGTLTASIGYDEAVYFFAAQNLWTGSMPYRDFMLVHPPGILLAISPFAWLSEVLPDSVSMIVANVCFGLLGSVAAALVAVLLLRYGRFAALVGGSVFAVWSAAVWSDVAPLQAPLLSTTLLGALVLLTRTSTPRPVLAGVLLGFGMTVKIWGAVPLVVLALWLLAKHGKPATARLLAGAAAAATLVCLPFFVMAPSDMTAQVLGFPMGRPRAEGGLSERVFYFSGSVLGLDRLPAAGWIVLGVLALAACAIPLVAALTDRQPPRAWPEPAWWSALALAQSVTLLASPSFYDHYAAFATPSLSLLIGYTAGLAAQRVTTPAGRAALGAAALAVLIVLTAGTLRTIDQGVRQPAGLAEALRDDRCTWALSPAPLITGDAAQRQASARCPVFVDQYVVLIDETGVTDARIPAATPNARGFQGTVAEQFAGSDAVLITDRELGLLAPRTRVALETSFRRRGTIGDYQHWRRVQK